MNEHDPKDPEDEVLDADGNVMPPGPSIFSFAEEDQKALDEIVPTAADGEPYPYEPTLDGFGEPAEGPTIDDLVAQDRADRQ